MGTIEPLVRDFLAQERIAVTGVSLKGRSPALPIYRKLQAAGYEVYAIHPAQPTLGDAPCYPNLAALPVKVDGVVIVNRPAVTVEIVRQCIACGVPRVWMHGSLGTHPRLLRRQAAAITSVSEEAVALCRMHGIQVIPGACPMMFLPPVDPAHTCARWINRLNGGLAA